MACQAIMLQSIQNQSSINPVVPLLIFGMSSNDVAINPEFLSIYVTKTDKHLSSSSLTPSVVNPYQRVNNSSFIRWLVIYFASAPVSTCCLCATTSVFVHYFRIWNYVPESFSSVICSTQREVVFNQETRKKTVQLSHLLV